MREQKATILVVDDEPGVRKLLNRFIQSGGHTVIEAVNGRQALDIFREQRPDLILTDLHMVEMGGMDLLKHIVLESPVTPVIIISGMGTKDDCVEALRLGAWDYLDKPVYSKELVIHAINGSLERARLLEKEEKHRQYLEKEIKKRTGELVAKNRELEQEISQRRIQEELVIHTKKEWERLVDSMPDFIAIVDRNFKFVRMNKSMAEKLNEDVWELCGKTCFLCVHGTEKKPDYCPHVKLLRDGKQHTVEIYEELIGGHYELTVIPYRDADGTLLGSVHVARDINQRKKTELEKDKLKSELLHAQKLESVGRLAAGIAHEINTPTQYVGTNIEFLDESFKDIAELVGRIQEVLDSSKGKGISADQVKDLEDALEEADWDYIAEEVPRAIRQSKEGVQRVTSIVQAMKEFSHPGSKEKVVADMNRIIETTVNVSRNEWKYVADLKTDLDPDLPKVMCLTDEMGQAILNMIVNAAHAIAESRKGNDEEKGMISIRTSHDEKSVEIRISDTGSGIPEAVRNRIFDPFFTTKDVGRGTGQGLAITHDVISEKHGGFIAFETKVGEGTTFIIKLPIAAG